MRGSVTRLLLLSLSFAALRRLPQLVLPSSSSSSSSLFLCWRPLTLLWCIVTLLGVSLLRRNLQYRHRAN